MAVLPLIMQGLKKIIWVENNKGWVCPLLCIGVSTAAAYFLQLPQWLLVGILTGAACNKVYDWSKDIKNGVTMFLMVLLSLMVIGGCSDPNAQLLASQKIFIATVDNLTTLQQAGEFTPEETTQISLAIHQAKTYLDQWYEANKAGQPRPDIIAAFNAYLDELIRYQASKK